MAELAWLPVASSNIDALAYEEPESTLLVKFRGGGIYRYEGVPLNVFESLRSATSVGRAFKLLIKGGGYAYQRMIEAPRG